LRLRGIFEGVILKEFVVTSKGNLKQISRREFEKDLSKGIWWGGSFGDLKGI
jgi:hypothetical protein